MSFFGDVSAELSNCPRHAEIWQVHEGSSTSLSAAIDKRGEAKSQDSGHHQQKRETNQERVPLPDALRYTSVGKRCGGGLPTGLEEHDVRAVLGEDGSILGLFVVEYPTLRGSKYVAYIRTSWRRGFLVPRTYRNRSDRMYRDLDRLVHLIRSEFGYYGPITTHVEGAPELRRFQAFIRSDGANFAVPDRAKTALLHNARLPEIGPSPTLSVRAI